MQASVAADHIHSSEHNLDIDGYRKTLPNVDYSRTHLNEVLIAEPLKDLYEREFGSAVKDYNARQKRKDRRIESYYDKISESGQEKLCYEVIVQLGDRDNNSALDAMNREVSSAAYKDYLARFREKYGHVLKIFEAVIHYDEATPHMHLAFVPVVANKGKNGLAIKNSFRQAMQELGIENGRAIEFYQGSHELLADVMRDHGIEKTASRYDRAGRSDMTKEEYVEFTRNQEKLIEAKKEVEATRSEAKEAYMQLAEIKDAVDQSDELIEALDQQILESQQTLARLQAEIDELKTEVGSLEARKSLLEKAIERLESVATRIVERLKPYMPDPLIWLARAWRDGNEWAKSDWHAAMDETAQDLVSELPGKLEEEIEAATSGREDPYESGFDTRETNVKRGEWNR